VSSATASRTFEVRHVQLARAAFAALAAIMITFSPDHSAAVGMAVFSGFAIATGLVLLLSIWLVYPAGQRWPIVLMAIVTILIGMVGGISLWRTVPVFFASVIVWALLTGVIELVAGIRARRALRSQDDPERRSEARDAIAVGAITLVLGVAMLFVPTGYALNYYIEDAGQAFTLTGITIGVGLFGAYAAIVAVYLAIAAFSPRKPALAPGASVEGDTASDRGSAA
jgi:MFS family permease